MSNSILLIKFDRNLISESAAEFLPHVRLVLNLIQNEKPSPSSPAVLDTLPLLHLLLPDSNLTTKTLNKFVKNVSSELTSENILFQISGFDG